MTQDTSTNHIVLKTPRCLFQMLGLEGSLIITRSSDCRCALSYFIMQIPKHTLIGLSNLLISQVKLNIYEIRNIYPMVNQFFERPSKIQLLYSLFEDNPPTCDLDLILLPTSGTLLTLPMIPFLNIHPPKWILSINFFY